MISSKIRELAAAELKSPVGAYDEIRADGRHPLAHLIDPERASFWTGLARAVDQELRQASGRFDPNSANYRDTVNLLTGKDRRELARLLTGKDTPMGINRHPLLARDQNLDLPPRGAVREAQYGDQADTPIDCDTCLQFVRMLINGLDDDERGKFIEGLGNLITGDGSGTNGLPHNNLGALDRRRRSVVRDNRGRRPAQDSAIAALNTQSFLRRFPEAGNIKFGGTGR